MQSSSRAQTYGAFFRELAELGDRPAVVKGDEVTTYAELDERSRRLARGLLARGVGKGARIGFVYPNSAEWVVACAAIARIGAVAVPLSTFLKPPEFARVIRHGDIAGVISTSRFLGQDFVHHLSLALPEASDPGVAGAGVDGGGLVLESTPFLRWVVFDGGEAPWWARSLDWLTGDDAVDRVPESVLAAAEAQVHRDEIATMIYTSGQSADPKGVLHAHGAVLDKIRYLSEMLAFDDATEADAVMPFFWVGGYAMNLFAVLAAGGVTRCAEAPTAMTTILGSVNREHLPMPGTDLYAGLGMSETFAIYSWGYSPPYPEYPLCCPLDLFEPGYSVRVVDEQGVDVADGETGQIIIRGPSVTRGLHKVDRSYAFDADGYYQTGDEGLVRGDQIVMVGRLGDMIKTSGANVAPSEVEAELVSLPGVVAAHVVAIADPDLAELVGAAVVQEPGAALDVAGIRGELRERLSNYKVPQLMVVLDSPDEVPTTPTMKIRKRDLAELIRARGA